MPMATCHRPWREWCLAVLAIVAFTLVCFAHLTVRPTGLLVGVQRSGQNDLTGFFLGWRDYPRVEWARSGGFPTWNPYLLCGVPYVGNPQSALYYPFNWLFLLAPAERIISWVIVFHHALMGLGTYLCARRWGQGPVAAVFAAGVLLAAPFIMAQTGEGHYAQLCVVTWVPWAFLAYDALRRGARGGLAALSLTLALSFFGGHAQECYYLVMVLCFCAVADFLRDRREPGPSTATSWARRWCLAGAATLGLVMIDLIPISTYLRLSTRSGGVSLAEVQAFSPGLPNLIQLVSPLALGGPNEYRGPGAFYWETVTAFGLVPLLLGLLEVWRGRRGSQTRRLALLWLGSILFALGPLSPIYLAAHHGLPGVSHFRVPSRMLFLGSFACAVLAGWGLQRILNGINDRPRTKFLVGGLLVAASWGQLAGHAWSVLRVIDHPPALDQAELGRMRGPDRILASQWILGDRDTMRAGLFKANGYEPAPLAATTRYFQVMNRRADRPIDLLGFLDDKLTDYAAEPLNLIGVERALLVRQSPPPGWTDLGPIPSKESRYHAFANTRALPRAFVVGRSVTALDEHTGEEFPDPRQFVVLSNDLLPGGTRQSFTAAQVLEQRPDRIVLEVAIEHPGYLVLSDAWYPGWSATVNGRAAPVLQANLMMRAVPLFNPGAQRVTLEYQVPGWRIGAVVSGLTMLTICVHLGLALSVRSKN